MIASAVYLDHHATTPVDETVLEAMLPFLRGSAANPASPHGAGRAAHGAVERAREQIAMLVGARSGEVILTSGATEASNLAIRGLRVDADRSKVITTTIEHPSVLEPIRRLGKFGREVVILAVNSDGRVDLDALAAAVDRRTALVSVGAANGEIGVTQDLVAISEIVHRHGALLHSDATQAVLTEQIDCHELEIDLLSISAHKLYGPQGIGALIANGQARDLLEPIVYGGGQENGQRSGTTNVAGAVGFGVAAELAFGHRTSTARRMAALRDTLAHRLTEELGATVNGSQTHRLAANLNVRIPGVEADALIASCRDVYFSAGSACSSGSPGPSPILTAIGLSPAEADESVRFGLGRATTAEGIARAGASVVSAARRIRSDQVALGAAA